MKIQVVGAILLLVAILAGVGILGCLLTFGLHWLFLGPPDSILLLCVLAGSIHIWLFVGFAVVGENLLEDIAKTVICVLGGCGWLLLMPLAGLSMISASLLALLINQGCQWANGRYAQEYQPDVETGYTIKPPSPWV